MLRKVGKVEFALLEQLVENAEADIRVERFIEELPLLEILEIDHRWPPAFDYNRY